jgi:hypothetical protein
MAKVKQTEAELQSKRQELVRALADVGAPSSYSDKLEKQAELFLQEQLKAALAITQRAITLAAILGAVIASIVGVTGTLVSKGIGLGGHFLAALPLVLFLIVALGKTVSAAKPTSFFYAGSNPLHWLDDVRDKKDFKLAQAEQIALYSQNITDNNANLKKSQESVESALKWAGLGLLLFTLVEFILGLTSIAREGLPTLFGAQDQTGVYLQSD